MNIYTFIKNIQKLDENDLIRGAEEEINKNEKELLSLQESQYDKGEDRYGEVLGHYSYATQAITKGRKRAGEPYNLLDTGEYRKALFLKAIQQGQSIKYLLGSTDYKSDLLKKKLGKRIYGLQDNNEEKLFEFAKKGIINVLNKTIK